MEAFSPKADLEDALERSRQTTESVSEGDPVGAVVHFLEILASLAMVALPGSLGGLDKKLRAPDKGSGAARNQIERDARRFNLNPARPASRQILENLDMTVEEYISRFRKSSVRQEMPGEFLNKTVREALASKNTAVRKLLHKGEFSK